MQKLPQENYNFSLKRGKYKILAILEKLPHDCLSKFNVVANS